MGSFLISVVIPIFEEGPQIIKNVQTVHDVLEKNEINHEFVLVDDGSKDDTWAHIDRLAKQMPAVRAFRFSRNFGKEAALCAGIDMVQGDACIIMDADLQHPPEKIPEMVRLWREEGYEIVEGVKVSRGKESLVNKLGSSLFYNVMKSLTGFELEGASDFKLLDAKVIGACRRLSERNTFFRGLATWVGYRRTSIEFEVAQRTHGTSKWSFFRLIQLSVNAISSFTSAPLQLISFLGVLFLIGAFLLGIQTLVSYLNGVSVSGFTTVILLLLIIGSVLMISLGIIGTYIAKIYEEVKQRPRYIIAESLERPEHP